MERNEEKTNAVGMQKEKETEYARKKRRSGVLLPIFSLPGEYGIGTLGKEAYEFVSYLAEAGMKVWQILPLLPTGYGDSPYQSVCSYALNYYFIDPETLRNDGLLSAEDLETARKNGDFEPLCGSLLCGGERIDYERLFYRRVPLLKKAFSRLPHAPEQIANGFASFLQKGEYYDFALFMALKEKFGYLPFSKWGEYAVYSEEKAAAFAKENEEEIRFWQFTQYEFLREWNALHAFAHEKGIEIFGDMPIYVSGDSVEMWKYGKLLFETDENGLQTQKAGVPPDAFSADGQLWGNPVYRWEDMKKDGYSWWKDRIGKAFDLYDIVRIDHFRAFDRYYSIDAAATSAREGRWLDGPKEALFDGMHSLEIVAEDLGLIDDGVLRLMKHVGYPGMRVLEFAFDGNAENTNKPSNSPVNSVTYTGTHDNIRKNCPSGNVRALLRISPRNAKRRGLNRRRKRRRNIAPTRCGWRLLHRRFFALFRCRIFSLSAKDRGSILRLRFPRKTGVTDFPASRFSLRR